MQTSKLTSRSVRALAIFVVGFLLLPQVIFAGTGAPKILNYQGRLMDPSGVLLGGAGTDYCFKFSFYDSPTIGSGAQIWPSVSPSTMTVTVKNGVFNVGIGDTSIGGDTLDYNFQDSDTVYLNVEVAAKVGATCAPGDGAETFETLGPRQRIYSSGFAINASTLSGYSVSQILSQAFSTTSADYFVTQRNFFSTSSADYLASQRNYFSTSSANFFVDSSSTVVKTYSNNIFGGIQTFANASTTNISASYASSTQGFFGSLNIGNLTGVLKAVAGAVTSGLVNLSSEVTGVLPVANGGTGWANVAAGAILYGNGSGALATTTAALPGQTLAYLNGVPTWTATTSYSNGLTYANGNVTLDSNFDKGFFFSTTSTDYWKTQNNFFSTTSAIYFADASTTIPKTYTANNFTATQSFGDIIAANATTTTLFSQIFVAPNGIFGNLSATSSATLASTTAYGQFLTANIISTSTATSSFNGALLVGIATSSYKASILSTATGATGSTGTGILTITNNDATLSSANNILRLNMRTPGQTCTTATTCPRFVEFFAGTPAGSDYGGTGLGRISMSTQGTGITQTSGAADFAEYMQLNASANIGDLVSLNSAGQYQKAVAGQSLIGVVSDNAAFVGNGNLEGSTNAYVVGFAGVIKTTVSTANGAINAGDFIAASSTSAGVGVKLLNSGYTLGQALESFSGTGTGTIKVLVLPKYIDASVALQSYGGTGGGDSGYWNLSTTTGVVSLASSTYSLVVSNASTTAFSSYYASSTNAFFGSLSVGTLTGVLRATAGVVTAGPISLVSDISGILPVANGGTGWANLAAGAVLYGNGTGAVATTTVGLPGQTLALLNGVPTWTSTTTYSGGLSYANGNVTLDTSGNWSGTFNGQNGAYYIANSFSTTSADYFSTQRNFFATTSAIYFVNASTTIPKTYSSNTFTGANIFNGTLTFGALNGPLEARNGIVSATSSIGAVYGGTGQTTYNPGDILYANTPTSLARIASSTSGTVLSLVNGMPTWTATTTFSGALTYANGNVTFSAPVSSALSIPYASSTSLTAGNLFATNATTTSLAITNIASGLVAVNGSGSAVKASVDTSLSFSNNTLALNMSNSNIWSGLQRFGNASSTQFSAGTAYFGATATTTIDASGNIIFGNSSADIVLQNGVDQALNFSTSTANVPTLTISTRASLNGLVGIGTSTPWGKLAVEMGTANPAFVVSNQGSSSPAFYVGGVNQNGLVGIGTSSPWATFSVDGSNASNKPILTVGSSSATYFLINNGGHVGIGTTNPQYSLDVNGDINVGSGNCFRVGGVCIGYTVKLAAIYATSTPGTSTVQFTGAPNSVPSFSGSTLTLQNNLSYYVVEMWGGGGGGGAQSTNAGTAGTQSCFAQGTIACGGSAQKQLVRANGGNGGAAAAGTAGAGGASDNTFGGVSLPGGNGLVGSTAGTGNGGSAPRGGGTAASSPTGQTGTTGSSPGGGAAGGGTFSGGGATQGSGGGGGAYSENVASTSVTTTSTFTVGAGGNGGAAGTVAGGKGASGGIVITVYATSSPNITGNDYAELFPVSSPLIEAGDIVAVDKGIPVSMKLGVAGDNAPLAGVISTQPGQTLGDQTATGMRPVALSGRVPVKVNLEGGIIHTGDRIALSSVAGVGKKAGMFDDSVGIALDTFDGTGGDKVMVFMDLQRGIDVNAIAFSLLGSDALSIANASSSSSTPSGPLDFVGGMMNAISKRLFAFGNQDAATTTTASSTLTYASSTPTAVDGFAKSLMDTIVGGITQMLANAGNGISDIFANVLHAKQEICVDDQCMSKSDVKELLKMAHSQTGSAATASINSPKLEIQGNNPATVNVGDAYSDLGARITSPQADLNLGITYLVDGLAADTPVIDTSFPAEHTITYRVIDPSGAVGEATRTVRVVNPVASDASSTPATADASSTPATGAAVSAPTDSASSTSSTISSSDASSTQPTS